MAVPELKTLEDLSSIDAPLYTLADAARYLRLPLWLVAFLNNRRLHPFEIHDVMWLHPEVQSRLADDEWPLFDSEPETRISFRKLAALFVASAVYLPLGPTLRDWFRRERAFGRFVEFSHDPRMFTDPEWVLGNLDKSLNHNVKYDQIRLLKSIVLYQSRIDFTGSDPVRMYPFAGVPAIDAPRSVVIKPGLRFGQPNVRGVPTDVISDRWQAGDSPTDLAEDYDITVSEVDEALRYESGSSQLMIPMFYPFFG